jgi:hypothetical protein
MIEKVEDKLEEIGIRIKNYYYVSESFYESNDDDVAWDKCRLLLQHLVGVKADGDVFDTQEIIRYEQIHFYDEDQKSVAMVDSIGKALQTMLANSQSSQKDTIRETIKSSMPELIINIVTPNKMKLFSTKKVKLEYANLVKSFESYGRIRK